MSLTSWAKALGICHKTLAERLARHSLEKALAAPKQLRGGGKPLERPVVELAEISHPTIPLGRRSTFRNVFDSEGATEFDSDQLLAMKWLEAHWNNPAQIQREFSRVFGAEVAARAVQYCVSIDRTQKGVTNGSY